ncbi:MAG: cytochrome c oxidase subunit II [Kineosporiaceae bacterium]
MRRAERVPAAAGPRRVVAALAALSTVLLVSGCGGSVKTGWLPSTRDTTDKTRRIIDLWNGSWIAALAVGVLVWGLMLWCVVAYRRRREETGLPAQVRYHLPLEILYTVVPLMMIAVLFFYTTRDMEALASTETKPDVTVQVVAKQWAWDFNYVNEGVYEVGVQGQLNGERGVEAQLPTLYLPVNKVVRFDITARDVNHSFWIPAFLYKMDAIPGLTNTFQVTPKREGVYKGKCAELCGEYHSEMLFNVAVVSEDEYERQIAALKDKGQTGRLGPELGRDGQLVDDTVKNGSSTNDTSAGGDD